jgi:hypothetical protein
MEWAVRVRLAAGADPPGRRGGGGDGRVRRQVHAGEGAEESLRDEWAGHVGGVYSCEIQKGLECVYSFGA